MESRNVRDWLEISAALAVFIGLLLVVQEIRVNTKAVAFQTAAANTTALTEPFFQSEHLLTATQKIKGIDGAFAPEAALVERYDLSPEEATVWARHLMQLWSLIGSTYKFQDKNVAIEQARTLLLAPDNRTYVESYEYFDPEFERVLDQLISEMDDSNVSN